MSRLKEKYLDILAWESLFIAEIGGGVVKVQGRPPDHNAPETESAQSYVAKSLAQIQAQVSLLADEPGGERPSSWDRLLRLSGDPAKLEVTVF